MTPFTKITVRLWLTILVVTPAVMVHLAGKSDASITHSQVGENIFRAKCSVCHGVDGGGRTANGKKLKVPDLRSDRVQNLEDDEILDVLSNGKGSMPPVGKKYSNDQLQQVIAHVRSLRKKD